MAPLAGIVTGAVPSIAPLKSVKVSVVASAVFAVFAMLISVCAVIKGKIQIGPTGALTAPSVKLEKSPPTQKDCRPIVALAAEIHPGLDAFGKSCEISAAVCAPAPTVLDAVPSTDPFPARKVNVTVAADVPGFTTAIPVDAISVVENNRGKLN